jgi:transposase
MEETDIKDKNFTIKIGTAIAVVFAVINFAVWFGIKTNNTERDIQELNKITLTINENLKEQKKKIETLEITQNSEALMFKELSMTINELKRTVETLTKKLDDAYRKQ